MTWRHHEAGPALDLSGDVSRFFEDLVYGAVRARGYDPTEATCCYLVALLADFARPDQLSCEALERPVTFLLDEAMRLEGRERFERLRTLGDAVLYTSGFFGPHLETRGVEIDYVSSLGARAYDGAARMLRHGPEPAAPDLFEELADRFTDFVLVLTDVSDDVLARSASSDRAMLKVYERWLHTGSTRLSAALANRGLMPMPANGMLH